MKKILILSLILLFSCSKDDNNKDCVCKKAKVTKGDGYFYITNLPIDCETGTVDSSNLPKDTFYIGCE